MIVCVPGVWIHLMDMMYTHHQHLKTHHHHEAVMSQNDEFV